MTFQFGTNWAYYAHHVGDIFGAPLAIEGLMAFLLEPASFAELFFFPVAQVKFVHTVGSVDVTATMWVLAVSSFDLLRGRDLAFAPRSFAVAKGLGRTSVLSDRRFYMFRMSR